MESVAIAGEPPVPFTPSSAPLNFAAISTLPQTVNSQSKPEGLAPGTLGVLLSSPSMHLRMPINPTTSTPVTRRSSCPFVLVVQRLPKFLVHNVVRHNLRMGLHLFAN